MGGIDFSVIKPTKFIKCRVVLTDEQKRIKELEAENARLRQRLNFVIDQLSNATEDAALLLKQRNAANAQLDFILDNLKEEKAP